MLKSSQNLAFALSDRIFTESGCGRDEKAKMKTQTIQAVQKKAMGGMIQKLFFGGKKSKGPAKAKAAKGKGQKPKRDFIDTTVS